MVGSNKIDNLPQANLNNIIGDYLNLQTAYGRAWTRSIANLYDVDIPISYTLPISGQVSPRSSATTKQSTILPNPFQNTFTFIAPSAGVLTIQDLYGREIINQKLTKGSFEISLQDVQSGVYFYSFEEAGQIIRSGKLVKL